MRATNTQIVLTAIGLLIAMMGLAGYIVDWVQAIGRPEIFQPPNYPAFEIMIGWLFIMMGLGVSFIKEK